MATFALVRKQGDEHIVIDIMRVPDDLEDTAKQDLLAINHSVPDTQWIQCSINTRAGVHLAGKDPLRMNFPGVGSKYYPELDAFSGPPPIEGVENFVLDKKILVWRPKTKSAYPSWIFDEDNCCWKAPIDRPSDGKKYKWNESILNWVAHPENPSGEYAWNEQTYEWSFAPTDGKTYKWNRQTNTWDEVAST